MADEKIKEKEDTPEIEWAILLVKTKTGVQLQNLPEEPGPESIDDFYKELVLLVRNISADHQAAVHAAKMMETMQKVTGLQKSGLVTPPGVKV